MAVGFVAHLALLAYALPAPRHAPMHMSTGVRRLAGAEDDAVPLAVQRAYYKQLKAGLLKPDARPLTSGRGTHFHDTAEDRRKRQREIRAQIVRRKETIRKAQEHRARMKRDAQRRREEAAAAAAAAAAATASAAAEKDAAGSEAVEDAPASGIISAPGATQQCAPEHPGSGFRHALCCLCYGKEHSP